MGIGCEFIDLMDKIGYEFHDINKLQTALTRSSYSNEMKDRGFRATSNESLEFLGDSVLQIVISEFLYDRYGNQGEGHLSDMRKNLVCESTLAKIAEGLNLGSYLNVGMGDELAGVRNKPKILADSLEAVIGAVYLDDRENGCLRYRQVVIDFFKEEIEFFINHGSCDFKTMLQQLVEKSGDSLLRYEYCEEGPDHSKKFKATAYIDNNNVGEGEGTTKRAAEMQAAKCALKLFGID